MEWCVRAEEVERDGTMRIYILDTSVVVKWFSEYNEDDMEKALSLRDKILEGEFNIIAPDLLFYELANVLRYNSRFTNKDVKDAVKSVYDMEFEVRGIDATITAHAIDMAFKFDVTVYDSCVMAISQIEDKPFVTADYKFAKKTKGFKNIVRLSEI